MDYLKNEKENISYIIELIHSSLDNLRFPSMEIKFSQEFMSNWKGKFSKVFAILENYKNSEFPVVVLGRLNSGKSSILNAFIGLEILPSANNDTTSLLTRVFFGETNVAHVIHNNGKKQQIECCKSEIFKYVNYRQCFFCDQIKQIDISINNEHLKNGVSLYDSPGLDSINELNEKISYNTLIRSNVVIVAFSGQDGGGQENYELIKKVFSLNLDKNYKIIFVITKSDLVDDEQLNEARDCLIELINKAKFELKKADIDQDYVICNVSSYLAIQYHKIKNGLTSEEDAKKNRRLNFSSNNDLEGIYRESKFAEFEQVLVKSIVDSNNKKKLTQNLLVVINNFLAELLEDYTFISNKIEHLKDLAKLKSECNDLNSLIELIRGSGKHEVEKLRKSIKNLDPYSAKNTENINMMITNIIKKIHGYIDNTPYAVLSKNKFENLNENIYKIAEKEIQIDITDFDENLKSMLQNTIDNIEKIIQENKSKMNDLFSYSNDKENYELSIYGVSIKSHFLLSGVVSSIVSGTLKSIAPAFTVSVAASIIYGGIIAPIAVLLLGIFNSIARDNNSIDKKKENLKEKICTAFTRSDIDTKIKSKILELNNKYLPICSLLDEWLDSILSEKINYYNSLANNYIKVKAESDVIKKNLELDINTIRLLFSEIGIAIKNI